MINYSNQSIIVAIIGMVGLLSTLTVLTTAFKRNCAGSGRYQ